MNDFHRKALSDWLNAQLSHDIRSPFSSMTGVVQLLIDEFDDMDPSSLKSFLSDLLIGSRHQLLVLDNLAVLSREARGCLELFPGARIPALMIPEIAARNGIPLTMDMGIPAEFVLPGDQVLMELAFTDWLCPAPGCSGNGDYHIRVDRGDLLLGAAGQSVPAGDSAEKGDVLPPNPLDPRFLPWMTVHLFRLCGHAVSREPSGEMEWIRIKG